MPGIGKQKDYKSTSADTSSRQIPFHNWLDKFPGKLYFKIQWSKINPLGNRKSVSTNGSRIFWIYHTTSVLYGNSQIKLVLHFQVNHLFQIAREQFHRQIKTLSNLIDICFSVSSNTQPWDILEILTMNYFRIRNFSFGNESFKTY